MVERITDQVYGYGHACYLYDKHVILETLWNGNMISPVVSTQSINITNKECKEMVKNEYCDRTKMICSDGECVSPNLKINRELYPRFFESKRQLNIKSCETKKIQIRAKSKGDDILSKSCKYGNEFCYMHDHVVIWDSDNLTVDFPFIKIGNANFFFRTDEDFIISTTKSIGFHLLKIEKHDSYELYKTSEGFYLNNEFITPWPSKNENIKFAHTQQNRMNVIKSEIDFSKEIERKRFIKERKEKCIEFQNQLDLLKIHHDKLFKIRDIRNGKHMIIYAYNGNLFLPKCINNITIDVKDTEFVIKNNKCVKDIPVKFVAHNLSGYGFLTPQKIVVKTSLKVDCNSITDSFILVDNNKRMISVEKRPHKIIVKLKDNYEKLVEIHSQLDITKNNYNYGDLFEELNHKNHLKIDESKENEYFLVYSDLREEQLNSSVVIDTFIEAAKKIMLDLNPSIVLGNAVVDLVDKTHLNLNEGLSSIFHIVLSLLALVIIILFIFLMIRYTSVCNASKNIDEHELANHIRLAIEDDSIRERHL